MIKGDNSIELLRLIAAERKFLYQVQPLGPTQKHDYMVALEIGELLYSGKSPNSPEVLKYIQDYWEGNPYEEGEEVCYEYLTSSARIIRQIDYDSEHY